MKLSKAVRPAAVIDASCLIYLLHLELLKSLVFKHSVVYVPRYVWEEVSTMHRSRYKLQRVRKDYKFLKQCAVTDESNVRILSDKELNHEAPIDRGEAEVVIQAQTRGVTDVLIDEKDGREKALEFALRPMGTCGLLIEFKKLKLVNGIAPLIAKLIEDFENFRISKPVLEECLEKAEELEFLDNLIKLLEKKRTEFQEKKRKEHIEKVRREKREKKLLRLKGKNNG